MNKKIIYEQNCIIIILIIVRQDEYNTYAQKTHMEQTKEKPKENKKKVVCFGNLFSVTYKKICSAHSNKQWEKIVRKK